jgi:hypothetical protein
VSKSLSVYSLTNWVSKSLNVYSLKPHPETQLFSSDSSLVLSRCQLQLTSHAAGIKWTRRTKQATDVQRLGAGPCRAAGSPG